MNNSDRLRDFWEEKPKKNVVAYHGIISNVQIADRWLDAGEIAFLNNQPVGIALKSGEPGDTIPVMLEGLVKINGELRNIRW